MIWSSKLYVGVFHAEWDFGAFGCRHFKLDRLRAKPSTPKPKSPTRTPKTITLNPKSCPKPEAQQPVSSRIRRDAPWARKLA